MTIAAAVEKDLLLDISVKGTPQPQGAIRSLGKGRPSVHANAERLLPWRVAVQLAAEEAMTEVTDAWPVTGPVAVELVFTVKKPQSAPKRTRTWPITRPDLDKLVRAALDSLTNAGAIRDDSQVIILHAYKTYPQEHLRALSSPGLVLAMWSVAP